MATFLSKAKAAVQKAVSKITTNARTQQAANQSRIASQTAKIQKSFSLPKYTPTGAKALPNPLSAIKSIGKGIASLPKAASQTPALNKKMASGVPNPLNMITALPKAAAKARKEQPLNYTPANFTPIPPKERKGAQWPSLPSVGVSTVGGLPQLGLKRKEKEGEQKEALAAETSPVSPPTAPPEATPPGSEPVPTSNLPTATQNIVSGAGQASQADIGRQIQQGLGTVQQSGLAAPADAATSRSVIDETLGAMGSGEPTGGQNLLSYLTGGQDPVLEQINASNQALLQSLYDRPTAMESYNQIAGQYNIPGIDMALMDIKRVMEGTDQDIRNEVTAAGGFATESQVMAMGVVRNTTNLKKFNALLDQRNAISDHIDRMMAFDKEDRAFAKEMIFTQMGLNDRRAQQHQQMTRDAREGLHSMFRTLGPAGFLASMGGDPNAIRVAERALGMAPGGLQAVASYVPPMSQMDLLDMEYKRAQIQKIKHDMATEGMSDLMKPLSPEDATKLGVNFGTPTWQAYGINPQDVALTKEEAENNSIRAQYYQNAVDALAPYGFTPETFTKAQAAKLSDPARGIIAMSYAVIRNPKVFRESGQVQDLLRRTGAIGGLRAQITGENYKPVKISDAIFTMNNVMKPIFAKALEIKEQQLQQQLQQQQNGGFGQPVYASNNYGVTSDPLGIFK